MGHFERGNLEIEFAPVFKIQRIQGRFARNWPYEPCPRPQAGAQDGVGQMGHTCLFHAQIHAQKADEGP